MKQRIRQRRALYTVLQEWLDETSLLQALQIFEEQFQDKPTAAINDYLTRIAPLYKDKVDAKTLRRSLMALLVRSDQQLAPDPLPQLQRFRASQVPNTTLSAQAKPSADQLALHKLISAMMGNVAFSQRKQLHAHIASQLKTRFRNGSFDLLAQYMLSENPQYLAGFDDRALQDFLSLIYVAACEVLGPVEADRWFGGSIAQLRQGDAEISRAVNRYL